MRVRPFCSAACALFLAALAVRVAGAVTPVQTAAQPAAPPAGYAGSDTASSVTRRRRPR